MVIQVDRQAGDPVYQQIADQIRQAVDAGELGGGERLPTIRELARSLRVNRDTVSLAYETLAAEGLVESTVGRGTFVARSAQGAPAPVSIPLSPQVERLLEFERTRPRFGDERGAVQMQALIPDPALYPADEFRRSLNRVMQEEGPEILLYGSPQGHPGLRRALAGRMQAAGVATDVEELVLCHGASQGIALAVRLFAAPGDEVAVEEPTYNNVLATLFALGLRPVPVPMREDGPDLDVLRRVLARPAVRLFYTIPTFHNPMGISTSTNHRRALLEVAAAAGVPVVEDAFEMDLWDTRRPPAPLAALDARGLVVNLFSFSKSLFPGARVGSVLARGAQVEAVLALKRATDLSDAMPLQAALADFVASGGYDRHLGRLRRTLRRRREALFEALASELPEPARWTEPDGGYQVWVELPEPIDTADLLGDATRRGLLFAPGYQFHVDGRASSALRLTVALTDEAQIRRGVAVLGEVVRERFRQAPRLANAARVHV